MTHSQVPLHPNQHCDVHGQGLEGHRQRVENAAKSGPVLTKAMSKAMILCTYKTIMCEKLFPYESNGD